MAAQSGAKYVAPYVNRLDNISADGVETVSRLVKALDVYKLNTKVLAASFKNAQQVLELIDVGVHSVTVSPDIAQAMASHPLTDISACNFRDDWKSAFGVDTPIDG